MRRRVHVLPRNLPVPEREDIDAVPLLRAGRRCPLADGEVFAGAERPRREPERRVIAEDLGDVLPYRHGALGPLVGRVVVEHDVRMVELVDRVEILRVPRGVVALDQVANGGCIHPVRELKRTTAAE